MTVGCIERDFERLWGLQLRTPQAFAAKQRLGSAIPQSNAVLLASVRNLFAHTTGSVRRDRQRTGSAGSYLRARYLLYMERVMRHHR